MDAANAIAYSHCNMLHTAERSKKVILRFLEFYCVSSPAKVNFSQFTHRDHLAFGQISANNMTILQHAVRITSKRLSF